MTDDFSGTQTATNTECHMNRYRTCQLPAPQGRAWCSVPCQPLAQLARTQEIRRARKAAPRLF